MKRMHGVLGVAVLVLGGCVSKSEVESVKQQLEGCERDKVAAQTASRDCEQRFDRESERWSSIESQITSTLPQTLRDFQDERAKIIQLVPEEVRKEVGGRLDRYFGNVSKQFQNMEGRLDEVKAQLSQAHEQLRGLSDSTRTVDRKLDQAQAERNAEKARLQGQNRRVSEIITLLASFDRDRINCEKCPERIKLKGNGREELLAFHSELIQRIQSLQIDETGGAPAGTGSGSD